MDKVEGLEDQFIILLNWIELPSLLLHTLCIRDQHQPL